MALKIREVKSTKLAGEVYDAEEFVLYLMFTNGGVYCYGDEQTPFEPEVYAEFLSAPSKGKFFNERISGPDRKHPIYPYRRIGDKTTFFKIGEEIPFKEKSLFITDEDLPKSMFDPDPRTVATPSHKIIDRKLEPLPSNDVAKQEVAISTTVIPELPDDLDALALHSMSVKQQVEGLTRVEGVKVALVVTDAKGYEAAVNLLVKLKAEQKIAQAKVDAVKKPVYEEYKKLLDKEKEVIGPYKVAIENLLDPACTTWRQAQRAAELAAEQAERKRQQDILDEQARVEAAEAKRLADSQAAAMEAAGQPEVAQQIREMPAIVIPQQAAPVIQQTAVPKVAGSTIRGTWKYRITDPLQVPRALVPQFAQVMLDHGYGPKDNAKSVDLLMVALGKVFSEFYTLDESKIGARTKLKEAAVNSIPGVDFFFSEKTGASGR